VYKRQILARLNQVVARVTDALTNSDTFAATLALEALLEDLTNWYVRRSRRRFWKSEQDEDKAQAYHTLYHVLVKMIRCLAPIVPFVTEVMYQNLVVQVRPEARLSVHHTDWPVADLQAVDETLLEQMALARRITSLGLSARSGANLRVRQPLARALVHVGEGAPDLMPELLAIIADELNVKALEFVAEPEQLVTYRLLPNNRLLGPRLGKDFPRVRAALAAMDPNQVARRVQAGETVTIHLDDSQVELAPEEILVQTQPATGLAVAADKVLTVAVDATVTPALKAEGLAREVVRRIQSMRKNADFAIADHITTWYETADPELDRTLAEWGDYIRAETLSDELVAGPPPVDAHREEHKLDGIRLTLAVRRKESR
jgi:isoleucyl-tRNA synthetase